MVKLKKSKRYTVEVNGCELISFLCGYDLEQELTEHEKDFVDSLICKIFYDEYKESLDLTYWKVKVLEDK